MSFREALKILDIEEYGDRIVHSNSHGELFHLLDYIVIARIYQKCKNQTWFKEWFEAIVKLAKKHWKRPESIFQHILKTLEGNMEIYNFLDNE